MLSYISAQYIIKIKLRKHLQIVIKIVRQVAHRTPMYSVNVLSLHIYKAIFIELLLLKNE
jgi:hypothetical protein